jgi:hypothetical protein
VIHNEENYTLLLFRRSLYGTLRTIVNPKFNAWWQKETGYLLISRSLGFLITELLPTEKQGALLTSDAGRVAVYTDEIDGLERLISALTTLLDGVERVDKFEFDLVKKYEWAEFVLVAADLADAMGPEAGHPSRGDIALFQIAVDASSEDWELENSQFPRVLDAVLNLYNGEEYPFWHPGGGGEGEEWEADLPHPVYQKMTFEQFRNDFLSGSGYPYYFAFSKDKTHSVMVVQEPSDYFIRFGISTAKLDLIPPFLESITGCYSVLLRRIDDQTFEPYEATDLFDDS